MRKPAVYIVIESKGNKVSRKLGKSMLPKRPRRFEENEVTESG